MINSKRRMTMKYKIQSDEHEVLMLKLGKVQIDKENLIYKHFKKRRPWVTLLKIAAVIALSVVFYKYFISTGLSDEITKIAATVVFAIAMFFPVSLIFAPIIDLINNIDKKKAYKYHSKEIKELDEQIDSLTKQIIKEYGGEKKKILNLSNKMYQKKLSENRLTYNTYHDYDSYSYGSYSSSSSTSSDSSSSYTQEWASSNSSKQRYVDDWGRDVAYRDGDRVYSSDTHDQVGYMSGNQLYDNDGHRVGEFDDNGNFTKYR